MLWYSFELPQQIEAIQVSTHTYASIKKTENNIA